MSSPKNVVLRALSPETRATLKTRVLDWKLRAIRWGFGYSPSDLEARLSEMGLCSGTAVVVHAAFDHFNGFLGRPQHLIDVILDIIGPSGHLFMPSMAYDGSSVDYLNEDRPFDVRRTPSRMGIVSECFRRRAGVLRSANPLHPVLALGPRAGWLVSGHEHQPYSCGKGSPFEKMLELDTQALFFGVDLNTLTFIHHLEDRFGAMAPEALYPREPHIVEIIDAAGENKRVSVFPFATPAAERRDFTSLFDRFEREGHVMRDRIGATSLALVSLRVLEAFATSFVDSGGSLWGPPGRGPRTAPTRGGPMRRTLATASGEIESGRIARDARRMWQRFRADSRANDRRRKLPSAARAEIERDAAGPDPVDPGPAASIEAALAWLCAAQDHSPSSDGGVAHSYSLVHGWAASYPETTGYIIPTLFECADSLGIADLNARACQMLDWLVSIQLPDGGFAGGIVGETSRSAVTFNTGQILMGLAAGAQARRDPRYSQALERAANFLAATQDADGCWRQHHSPLAWLGDHTYDTHVAWGMLEAARVTGCKRYAEVALANVRWALTHQRPNGWFGRCCLELPMAPLTHTLAYALRGVIEAYVFSHEESYLVAARKTADALLRVMTPDGSIPGRLQSDFTPSVSWVCLTGSAQIALCWMILYRITGKAAYLDAARNANRFLRRCVRCDGPQETRGGVKGSFPVDGDYASFSYPNWACKFFIDSNRMELGLLTGAAQGSSPG